MKTHSRSIAFTWLLSLFVLPGASFAQDGSPANNPPDAVVALAQHAVTLWRGSASTTYTFAPPKRPVWYTGDHWWEIRCGALVMIDAEQNKIRSLDYAGDDDTIESSFQQHIPISIDQSEAIAAAQSLSKKLGVSVDTGDWRVIGAQIGDGNPYPHTWVIDMAHYVDGYPCYEDRIAADVNPYTGKVDGWILFNAAGQHIASTGSLLTVDQAKVLAQSAFNQYASDVLAQSPGMIVTSRDVSYVGTSGPAWTMLSNTSTDCRLAYSFIFDIPGDANTMPGGIEAIIDAQTGELWGINWGTVGIGKGVLKAVPPSPRFAILKSLYQNKTARPLAHAMASGKPARATAPRQTALRFTMSVSGKEVSFAFNREENRLTWQCGASTWEGVALPPRNVTRLLRQITVPILVSIVEAAATAQ